MATALHGGMRSRARAESRTEPRAAGSDFARPPPSSLRRASSPPTHDAELTSLARARGPPRRLLAALAGRFVVIRGWERLGFARLQDYARERLGVAARTVQDLAHCEAALSQHPRLAHALVSGRLPWTKVRLVARVASPQNLEAWLAFAGRLSVRALEKEVRRVDRASLERVGAAGAGRPGAPLVARETDADGAERWPGEWVSVPCVPRVQARWYHARQLARRVAGEPVPPWQCLESIAAEVLSGIPLSDEAARRLEEDEHAEPLAEAPASDLVAPSTPVSSLANVCAAHAPVCDGSTLAAPQSPTLPAELAPLADEIEHADAFAHDHRLRAALAFEQRLESRMGPLLRRALAERFHRSAGFPRFAGYVETRLGLSPRRARALVRIERLAAQAPALALAYREARLSWVQANVLAGLLAADATHAPSWIAHAERVSVRRLLEDVDAALSGAGALAPPTLPERLAADAPTITAVATPSVERQTGAAPTRPGHDTLEAALAAPAPDLVRVMVYAPCDVARLFRAALCTMRRHLERQTGRLPTPGEAFEAMLEHATQSWTPERRRPRELAVFERDGWRCTVPGCSSLRNLHDHHVVFRSRGGSDELSNRTTLCAWHHLRAVHRGLVRCTGMAPHALRFELGLRATAPPLLTYVSGELRQ